MKAANVTDFISEMIVNKELPDEYVRTNSFLILSSLADIMPLTN
ncbi:hypothetical protein RINTHH_13860 [Richelia intracellularis HH01]|mgnify:CR=1 FL=1|jgi:hypothetical protein|uniref:Uncharacterized protein n=1 Tax=Richelia intracellularis HH01 TaxID=1165094 RepID=M1X5Q2_9NOST|nr:hypothetical protein RINTHH_13860 [Richelia intracellularis HH01]